MEGTSLGLFVGYKQPLWHGSNVYVGGEVSHSADTVKQLPSVNSEAFGSESGKTRAVIRLAKELNSLSPYVNVGVVTTDNSASKFNNTDFISVYGGVNRNNLGVTMGTGIDYALGNRGGIHIGYNYIATQKVSYKNTGGGTAAGQFRLTGSEVTLGFNMEL